MRRPKLMFPIILLAAAYSVVFLPALAASGAEGRELKELDGEWIYFEDRTEGRALEQQGPPMSAKFSLRSGDGEVILVSGHGSGHRDVRVSLDGSATEVAGARAGTLARYRGSWKAGVFTTRTDFVRAAGKEPEGLIRREFRPIDEGLLVRVTLASLPDYEAVGLYRHAEDIPMPRPAKAAIDDLKRLAGAWVGTRGRTGSTSIEERWSPPRGGSMLAVSRTVSRGKLTGFEYLRVVERNDGLVYVAQPGGRAPTEFVLTELDAKRAVFANPRHDYPKRIVYDFSTEGELNVSIGFMKGGSPRQFKFKREGD